LYIQITLGHIGVIKENNGEGFNIANSSPQLLRQHQTRPCPTFVITTDLSNVQRRSYRGIGLSDAAAPDSRVQGMAK